jgi:hypothetical protein
MASQQFTASQREAIWLAHGKKCAYTSELLDVSSFHIDHILPERLTDHPEELSKLKVQLGLPDDFDVRGYDNLLPCRPGANLQKGSVVLYAASTQFFLGIARSKTEIVQKHLALIDKRSKRGKALILLQQFLERGDLSASEVAEILEKHGEQPDQIFTLLKEMKFADSTEIRAIGKTDIEALLDRPIRLGENDHLDGVTLKDDAGAEVHVRTCRQYNAATQDGFYALSTFDIKMATFFEHQCGLLTALKVARTPEVSFIADPKVGIIDLDLMPFSLFPQFGESLDAESNATYQTKLGEGTIVIEKLKHNLLRVAEPQGMGHQLIEVARADFDGDGIEDIWCLSIAGRHTAPWGVAVFGS